jgi:hypothetical protein
MKTSSILILSAVAVTFLAITAFNLNQKTIYSKGEWKKRFYGMEFIAMKNISDVILPDADKFELVIEKGDKEGLYIYPESKEHVQWSQQGSSLKIEVTQKAKAGAPFRNRELVLILKNITHLKTSPYVPLKFQKSYDSGEISISGFKQSSLKLDIGNRSNVTLEKTDIDSLQAIVGNIEGESSLKINMNNKINSATFNIPGKSELTLMNPRIVKTSYQLSDQATVTLNGNALQVLK